MPWCPASRRARCWVSRRRSFIRCPRPRNKRGNPCCRPPASRFQFDADDVDSGFPTYVTPDPPRAAVIRYPTQQTTGGQGWMYYSSLPAGSTTYVGHRVQVTLQSLVPTLSIQRVGHNVTISWSPLTPGFGLETETNLSSTNWAAIAAMNGISMPLDSTNRFYRLRMP